MIGQESQSLGYATANPELLHAAAELGTSSGYGTLILDRFGSILSCGAPAEIIFGAGHARLVGRPISEFIASLFLRGTSPSYCARHLVYLCADDEWRRFEARDVTSRHFAVEAILSRMNVDGQEMFLLTVRRPEAAE